MGVCGGSGQSLAGSRVDSSQELFQKMRWEKGKRRSSTGIKDSGKNTETRKEEQDLSTVSDGLLCLCVYGGFFVHFST